MEKIILRTFVLALAIILSACNDDIFIKNLTLSDVPEELGPDRLSASIAVEGTDWYIMKDVVFAGSEGAASYVESDNGIFHVATAFADLYVRQAKDKIKLELVRYQGGEPGLLSFTVTDGYAYRDVAVTVLPTSDFTIEIKDISYTLTSWTGYPEEDRTVAIMSKPYPEGLTEPMEFSFPTVRELHVDYFFEAWGDPDDFERMVLGSGFEVPVPSYTLHINPQNGYWTIAGDSASLTLNSSTFITSCVPPMPEAVLLPAGTPLTVKLRCQYDSVGLECLITAVNTATGEERDVHCVLRMRVPVRLQVNIDSEI